MRQSGVLVDKTIKGINDNFKTTGPVVERQAKAIESSMRNATRNLGFQFQDVATQLLSGQSPFTVAAQQSSQAADAMKELGRSGGLLKGVFGALGSVISPQALGISAAILGFGYVTQAAREYFQSAEEGSEEAAKAIREHADELKAIRDRWGELHPAVKIYVDELLEAANATQKLADRQKLLEKAWEPVIDVTEDVENAILDLELKLENLGQSDAIRELRQAQAAWRAEVDAGRPGLDQLKRLQDLITRAAELTGVSVDDLVSKIAHDLIPALRKAAEQANEISRSFGEMPRSLAGAGPPPAGLGVEIRREEERRLSEPVEFLKSRAVSDKIRVAIDKLDRDFADNLAEFLRRFPGVKITSAFRSFEEQRRIYDSGVRPAARPGRSQHEKGLAVDLSFGGMSAAEIRALQQEARRFGIDFPLPGSDAGHAQSLRVRVEAAQDAAEKNAKNLESERLQYDQLIGSITEKLDAQLRENQINGDLTASQDARTAAIEREKIVTELNAQAKQAGLVVDDALIRKHTEIADKMFAAGLAASGLAEQHRQLARAKEEDIRQAEQLAAAYAGIAKTAISGFVNDLRNGVEAGDAFRNMLDRVIDGLINMTIEALFAKNALGGVFGGLLGGGQFGIATGGGVGLYHQGGEVGKSPVPRRRVSPALFANAPRLHSGLMPGEFPAILQRGEAVIPRNMVKRGSRETTINTTNIGDISVDVSTGMVTATHEDGRRLGMQIDAAVQAVLVKESRPGGLLRQRQ
nr:phage tail length tape measure family protein [Sinorhizobium meliloti]